MKTKTKICWQLQKPRGDMIEKKNFGEIKYYDLSDVTVLFFVSKKVRQ